MATPIIFGLGMSSCRIGGLNVFWVTCGKDFDDQVSNKISKVKSRIRELINCVPLIFGVHLYL